MIEWKDTIIRYMLYLVISSLLVGGIVAAASYVLEGKQALERGFVLGLFLGVMGALVFIALQVVLILRQQKRDKQR